ncbi:hypothetical protein [Jatrophihabitans endophyticus]|uniref:hypothetical protein n=1 Tax=Jatrophihabitans endophyticus TaxID=1206085 RepID=UPI0034CF7C96
MRDKPCSASIRTGRLRKAIQFLDQAMVIKDLADDDDDVSDAFVSLCVLAGIAAADVVCCARLGRYAQGEDHGQAVALLEQASRPAAPHLSRLLDIKSKAAYTSTAASRTDVRLAERAAGQLVDFARQSSG